MLSFKRTWAGLLVAWPAPAAVGGMLAIAVGAVGEPQRGMSFALAGAAASIVLARIELERAREEAAELRYELEHALDHDGFLDTETGLGTVAMLRLDWTRQLARYQRRGERFSVAAFDFDLTDEAETINPVLLRAAADCLKSLIRTEDSMYRVGPSRFAVLLAGSDTAGAQAFVERVKAASPDWILPSRSEPLAFTGDVIDWREGLSSFPEHRLLWDYATSEMSAGIFGRWSDRDGGNTAA